MNKDIIRWRRDCGEADLRRLLVQGIWHNDGSKDGTALLLIPLTSHLDQKVNETTIELYLIRYQKLLCWRATVTYLMRRDHGIT